MPNNVMQVVSSCVSVTVFAINKMGEATYISQSTRVFLRRRFISEPVLERELYVPCALRCLQQAEGCPDGAVGTVEDRRVGQIDEFSPQVHALPVGDAKGFLQVEIEGCETRSA